MEANKDLFKLSKTIYHVQYYIYNYDALEYTLKFSHNGHAYLVRVLHNSDKVYKIGATPMDLRLK